MTPEDRPVRLHMHGNDIFSGAHFGEGDAAEPPWHCQMLLAQQTVCDMADSYAMQMNILQTTWNFHLRSQLMMFSESHQHAKIKWTHPPAASCRGSQCKCCSCFLQLTQVGQSSKGGIFNGKQAESAQQHGCFPMSMLGHFRASGA